MFCLELSSPITLVEPNVWILSVDGASNLKGGGAWVVPEGLDEVSHKQSNHFHFKEINNSVKIEALILGMKFASEKMWHDHSKMWLSISKKANQISITRKILEDSQRYKE